MKRLFFALLASLMVSISDASAGNPLEALGGIVTSLTSTSKFEIKDLQGTWSYQSPAVSFKSDQALNKIGGTAASAALESKMSPYYQRLGLNTIVLTMNADGGFEMKIKSITLKGTATKDTDDGALTFNFNAFGKTSIGKISAQAQKSATGVLTLTFDVSRVIAIVDKVASVANIQSVSTLSSLLNSYDGIYAGAKFKKSGNASSIGSETTSEGTKTDAAQKAADALQGLLGGKKKQ
ncbi:MAG: DUF4923 family protein [Muribaculaceae bacterium]|nr:DUF4923 family protein [Muribaculaceae bacterium]